ncbi:hypothetical protein CYMTET_34793, partial [Cymbomonas tetramitiformis]
MFVCFNVEIGSLHAEEGTDASKLTLPARNSPGNAPQSFANATPFRAITLMTSSPLLATSPFSQPAAVPTSVFAHKKLSDLRTDSPARRKALSHDSAKHNDSVYLRFVSSQYIMEPHVTVLGLACDALSDSGTDWTVALALSPDRVPGDEMPVTFDISQVINQQGMLGYGANATTDGTIVHFDPISPNISGSSIASTNADTSMVKPGDTIHLTITATEAVCSDTYPCSATIHGHPANISTNASKHQVVASLTLDEDALPYTEGQVQFVVTGIADLAGNPHPDVSNTSDGTSLTYDATPPTADLATDAVLTTAPFVLRLQFSEPVRCNASGDLDGSGGGAGALLDAPDTTVLEWTPPLTEELSSVYEALVEPHMDGNYSFHIAANAFTDAAGNAGRASQTVYVAYDTEAANASISSVSVDAFTYVSNATIRLACTEQEGWCKYETCLLQMDEGAAQGGARCADSSFRESAGTLEYADLPAAGFQLLPAEAGACGDIGAWPITDEEQCARAAAYAGLADAVPSTCSAANSSAIPQHSNRSAEIPPGCSYVTGADAQWRLWYNDGDTQCVVEGLGCQAQAGCVRGLCDGHPGLVSAVLGAPEQSGVAGDSLEVSNWTWPESSGWTLFGWVHPTGREVNPAVAQYYWLTSREQGCDAQEEEEACALLQLEARFPAVGQWQHVALVGSASSAASAWDLSAYVDGADWGGWGATAAGRANMSTLTFGLQNANSGELGGFSDLVLAQIYVVPGNSSQEQASLAMAACQPELLPFTPLFAGWLVNASDGRDVSGYGHDMEVAMEAGKWMRSPGNMARSCAVVHRVEVRARDAAGNMQHGPPDAREWRIVPQADVEDAVVLMVLTIVGEGGESECDVDPTKGCVASGELQVQSLALGQLQWHLSQPSVDWLSVNGSTSGALDSRAADQVRLIGNLSRAGDFTGDLTTFLDISTSDGLRPELQVSVTMKQRFAPSYTLDEAQYELNYENEKVLWASEETKLLEFTLDAKDTWRTLSLQNLGDLELKWRLCECEESGPCCPETIGEDGLRCVLLYDFPSWVTLAPLSGQLNGTSRAEHSFNASFNLADINPNTYEWKFQVQHNGDIENEHFSVCEPLNIVMRAESSETLVITPTEVSNTISGGETVLDTLTVVNVGPALRYTVSVNYTDANGTAVTAEEAAALSWLHVTPTEASISFAVAQTVTLTMAYTEQQLHLGDLTAQIIIANDYDARVTVIAAQLEALPGTSNTTMSQVEVACVAPPSLGTTCVAQDLGVPFELEAGSTLHVTITTFDFLGNNRSLLLERRPDQRTFSGGFRAVVAELEGDAVTAASETSTDNGNGTHTLQATVFTAQGVHELYLLEDPFASANDTHEACSQGERPAGCITLGGAALGPVTVRASVALAARSVLKGSKQLVTLAGAAQLLVVQARDTYGNDLRENSTGRFSLALWLNQSASYGQSDMVTAEEPYSEQSVAEGDGTYTISWAATHAGTYTLCVTGITEAEPAESEVHVINGDCEVQLEVSHSTMNGNRTFAVMQRSLDAWASFEKGDVNASFNPLIEPLNMTLDEIMAYQSENRS